MAEKTNTKTKITEYFGKGPVRLASDKQKQTTETKNESVNGEKEDVNGKKYDYDNDTQVNRDKDDVGCVKTMENDTDTNEALVENVDEDEASEMQFPCSNCDFITGDENEIIMHMNECAELEDINMESLKTDEDGAIQQDADLNDTEGNDNTGELQYPCSNCDYFSSDLTEIAVHMATCADLEDPNTSVDFSESKENVNDNSRLTNSGDGRIELHFTCSNCDFIGTTEDEVLSHMKSCPDDYDLKAQPYYTVYKHDLINKTYKFIYSSQDQETNKKALQQVSGIATQIHNKQKLKKIRIIDANSNNQPKRKRVHTAKGSAYNALMKEKNPLKKEYTCEICDFTTENKFYIGQHISLTHSDEKPYECKECGYRCKRPGDLRSHMLVHQEKVRNYICDICNWSTYKNSKLKVHKRMHTGEKPYKCDVCDYASFKSDGLSSHMQTHSLERPHKCDVCGKAFKQGHNLNSHKKIHTGEQPKNHHCTICDYAAVTPHSLKVHLLTHTDERPYKCPKCDYRCKSSSNLKAHMLKHSNKKPYICFECGFSTKIPQTLKRHSKIHTREHCATPEQKTMKLRDEENQEESAETENIYIKCEF